MSLGNACTWLLHWTIAAMEISADKNQFPRTEDRPSNLHLVTATCSVWGFFQASGSSRISVSINTAQDNHTLTCSSGSPFPRQHCFPGKPLYQPPSPLSTPTHRRRFLSTVLELCDAFSPKYSLVPRAFLRTWSWLRDTLILLPTAVGVSLCHPSELFTASPAKDQPCSLPALLPW